MTKTAIRLAFAAASFAAVQAHAVTVNFTGVVDDVQSFGAAGPAIGTTITGWYTVDTNAPGYVWSGDGSTNAQQYAVDDSGANTLRISGAAHFSDGTVLNLASVNDSGQTGQLIYRDYGGSINQVENYVETYVNGDSSTNFLEISAYDYNGTASKMFTDPTAGVSFNQGVNANSVDMGLGGAFAGATADGFYYGDFVPTSITISAVPESGNPALLLSGLGLVGIAARRRQQASRG